MTHCVSSGVNLKPGPDGTKALGGVGQPSFPVGVESYSPVDSVIIMSGEELPLPVADVDVLFLGPNE